VLPTAETPAVAEADDSERDDELQRLQRLLGMTQSSAEPEDAAGDDDSDGESSDDADTEEKDD
jgi:hypothetical protein